MKNTNVVLIVFAVASIAAGTLIGTWHKISPSAAEIRRACGTDRNFATSMCIISAHGKCDLLMSGGDPSFGIYARCLNFDWESRLR